MSETVSDLQWLLATPAEKCVLWCQRYWPEVCMTVGVLTMLGAQLVRAYLAGRL